ncbi:lysylphosphatidylglycerol synthetase family protein [Elioraea sp. Yellowstone]|uniref:phosphatidylglycerol lysyltransferase domain-containing protein n=1 Tax=Elioraea sp. Yellowstone TaxID=2592070 RepID=UPI001152D17D|nr:phosphatidylglycerol lysyltransferase domain-containing protein [Elioraea sp. Yellowstone]TQF76823.1 lysylphosphatidylglycerol synthetase family protein [Elioraea sp. Yellowstone]
MSEGRTASLLRHAPAVLGIALLVGALYVVQRELASLRLDDVLHAMDAMPLASLALALAITVVAYLVLTLYDALGTRFVGHPLSYGRIAFASFTAYALSHNIGFAMVSGAAIRYRLYALWGLSALQIAGVVAFCSLTFVLGGLTLGGIVLLAVPEAVPGFGGWVATPVMHAVGVAMLGSVAAYTVAGRLRGRPLRFGRTEVPLPGPRLAVMQVALATVDVALTALIFYVLLPEAPGLSFLVFLAVYVTAYTAAMASHVPGGLGVFDGTILLGLTDIVPAATVVGALLMFRLYYYILPLFLAGALFALNEIVLRRVAVARAFDQMARWGSPFVAPVLSAAVTLAGVVMLFLGTAPPFQAPFAWAGVTAPTPIVEVSHFAASILGAALLVLAYGLWRHVTMAWAAVLVTLTLAAGLAAVKGHGWPVPAMMLAIALCVLPFRRNFYRDTRLVAEPFTAGWVAAVVALAVCTVSLALFAHLRRDWAAETWWAFVLVGDAPWSLRGTIALGVALLLAALFRLLRPARVAALAPSGAAAERYAGLAGAPVPCRADGLVFGEARAAAVAFMRLDGIWLAIGDPVGDPHDRISAIWRFRDLCEQENVDPAFWRVGPELLQVYSDIGLTPFPLTARGEVAPESAGDTPPAAHYLVCRAERDLMRLLPVVPELARAIERIGEPA